MNDNDVRQILNILKPYINKCVDERTIGVVYRLPGVVLEADNSRHRADVILPSSPNRADQKMNLMNCTGNSLSEGDNVWVEYMYSLDNAYIAIKNTGDAWGW